MYDFIEKNEMKNVNQKAVMLNCRAIYFLSLNNLKMYKFRNVCCYKVFTGIQIGIFTCPILVRKN